jgi:cyclase
VLRRRIIPCLDVKDGRVVKGTRFVDLTDEGDPVELATAYARAGADEICVLDIGATPGGQETMHGIIRAIAEHVFVPLTVGGGVRSVSDMKAVLRSGADKVAVNSSAVRSPRLIADCAGAFGSQCVVVSVDARRVGRSWTIHTSGGRVDTGIDAITWAERAVRLGAGELLVTSMDRDGTNDGYDLSLLGAIRRRVSVPIVASGGAGGPDDLIAVFDRGVADAVLAASIFHRSHYTIADVKTALSGAGIPVRSVA